MRTESIAGKTFRCLVASILLALLPWPGFSNERSLAVIYPDVREPYQSVFQEIIAGVDEQSARQVKTYVLSREYEQKALEAWLTNNNIGAIIALGRSGVNVAASVADLLPVIAGALLLTPDPDGKQESGISLDTDPEILFRQLKMLAPGIQRVHVIYDPQASAWLIDLARIAARHHGLELSAYPAESMKQSARLYRDVLEKADPRNSALWIPVDAATVDEKVILPLVLKESWDRSLLVFSSNPAHAKRGALFSFYPDNVALGRRLAAMAEQSISDGARFDPVIFPLRDVRIAVNRRTADHLGISITREQQQKFDLMFPAP
ncbi:MAG: hypothetical protein FD165_2218 [Gammaproteobacteria bacterium]|nr:MAG: hypothetical protein FD165_2218 [Gammaproteobacteria bacterium]TND03258.1 MAG: hypothetical protein FD120_1931 [Gammaproteobacteria bacterium]